MRIKKIIVLMIAALLACRFLAGCSGGPASETTGVSDSGTYADGEHGRVISVVYSCAGGQTVEESFSFYAAASDGGNVFSYFFYDLVGKRIEGERAVGEDDMNDLRALIEMYGYSELIGQKTEPDFGNEEELDAPTYYLNICYEDGRSMTSSTAGEGGLALEAFFKSLAEKGDQ